MQVSVCDDDRPASLVPPDAEDEGPGVHMCVDIRIDMCVDVCVDMCMGMCMGMGIAMCA